MDLLDWLFPKRCVGCGRFGDYFCQQCLVQIKLLEKQFCPICERPAYKGKTHPSCLGPYTIDGIFSVFTFTSPLKEAIYSLKYRYNSDLANKLVKLLTQNLGELGFIVSGETVLVPVPLHPRRLKWRGFNQAQLLAEKLASRVGLVCLSGSLVRVKDTQPQVKLQGKQRRQNVFQAFRVVDPKLVQGQQIVLIDDMRTTGATLRNCATSLKRAGAKSVWGLTLAAVA